MEGSQVAAFFIEFFAFVLRIVPIPNLISHILVSDGLGHPVIKNLLRAVLFTRNSPFL